MGGLFFTLLAIFPRPQAMETLERGFPLDTRAVIVTPEGASDRDRSLGRLLAAELSDRYGFAIRTRSRAAAGERAILMGSAASPLIRAAAAKRGLKLPGAEGYVLDTSGDELLVAGADDAGAFYGLQSLRQLIGQDASGLRVEGARVHDWPYKPFRAVKLYLPGPDHIAFFKRFVRDFAALYKFNRIVMEMNAGMRLERHPELNAGWMEFARDLHYRRWERPEGPNRQGSNSSHQDTADGRVVEKRDVAELVRYAAENFIELTPEIPSLAHSYYLLTRHRELAEVPAAVWPDTYCPSNPQSYELLFDVLDEYIEVTRPRMIHMGHDEWGMDISACPRCRGKDTGELFAADVKKIHAHLKARGIRMAIWGDFLLEAVAGKSPRKRSDHVGRPYYVPGALRPEQVAPIPKDILIFNWFWAEQGQEANERQLSEWGFEQVFGNFRPGMDDYGRRSRRKGVLGGAPSAWTSTTEFNFGKDVLLEFAGSAEMVWSGIGDPPERVAMRVQTLMPEIRRAFTGVDPPSRAGDPIVQVPLPPAGAPIPIGEDPSSLIFLHASRRRAGNEQGHRSIYNFEDTADLLGFYEVVYEDGLELTVPIRYGVNIMEKGWKPGVTPGKRAPNDPTVWSNSWYCYGADPVDGAFAYEWVNPRFGKKIREVRLRATSGFTNFTGRVIPENGVVLEGLKMVRKR